jgi:hypothetical protein
MVGNICGIYEGVVIMKRDAIFSNSRKYRYSLLREWDSSLPRVLYVMLNPSIADDEADDQTIKRCIYFAKKFGFGSLEVVNLYALISTDPSAIRTESEPEGKENDSHILEAAKRSSKIIVAWGEKGFYNQRHNKVTRMLYDNGYNLYCLKLTKERHYPRHPSRLPNSCELELFTTQEFLKELYTVRVINAIRTVSNNSLLSREGYDPVVGSDFAFHSDFD